VSRYGEQPFKGLKYCARCCMPETAEGINFDEMNICRSCRSSEMKMRINWLEREKALRDILEHYKKNSGDNYDCIVPISGGKDSTFQLHVLTRVYDMKPLAVTFSHNWFSETGKYNLHNALEKFNVDHIMFTPNRKLVNKIAKRSLEKIGDACWTCHAGVGAFPLQVAMRFGVKLMIWGESVAELGCKASYGKPIEFDDKYYLKISSKVNIGAMIDDNLTKKDLYPFRLPTGEEFKKSGIRGIHLGDYIFWDGERQVEFIKKEYGWRETDVDGTYKGYKSAECVMTGVHDYSKFIKRGFGRVTDHVCQDVRAGLMSREEGFELIKKLDPKRPIGLDHYLEITGMTEEEFEKILKGQRKGKARELP